MAARGIGTASRRCLPDAIAIDLPADDDSADLTTYADTIVDAVSGASGPLILVAQSMGAFTAPMVASRVPRRVDRVGQPDGAGGR